MQVKPFTSNNEQNVCPGCGLQVADGGLSCEAQRDALLARDFEQPSLYWSSHRIAVDAYCLQHPAYVASAKSLAAHLCGLCISFERGDDPNELRKLQRWLSTNPKIEKPLLPGFRGEITIADVSAIEDPSSFQKAVKFWAVAVWNAYEHVHVTAHDWLLLADEVRAEEGPKGRR